MLKNEERSRAQQEERTNWAALAGARFVLSVVVLLCHLALVSRSVLTNVFEQFNAFSAVVAFFLISGYSIHLSISRDSRDYLARRFWRIYPIYVASLLLAIVLFFAIKPVHVVENWWLRQTNGAALASHFVFGQSFWTPSLANFSPSWSLGIEVLFYALAPLFLRCDNCVLLRVVMASVALYLINPLGIPFHDNPNPIVAVSLLWAWLLGWMAATEKTPIFRAILIGLPILCVSFYTESPGYLGFVTVGATAFLLLNSHKIVLSPLVAKIFNFLGDCSYPLYLVHWPILWACLLRGVTSQTFCLFLVALATLGITLADNAFKRSAIIRRGALRTSRAISS